MQVTVNQQELVNMLGRCQGVADKKSTMPVLGNVLLEVVGPDRLRLAATDLYLSLTTTLTAKVERGGSIALGARDLQTRVTNMPAGELILSVDEGAKAVLRAPSSARRYTLQGLPGDEFPTLPQADGAVERVQMPAEALLALINATHFSISHDDTRLNLNSALFEWEGERMRMVTTDGHRLTKLELAVPGSRGSASMLIPRKGVLELRELCQELVAVAAKGSADSATLVMAQSGPNVFFQAGHLELGIKLVEAQFPPYQQVVPSSSQHYVDIPRRETDQTLRAVSVAASDRTSGIKLTLGQRVMRFESEGPDSGAAFDEIPIDYDGDTVSIGFNASYLREVLGAIDTDSVRLGLSGTLDPVVVMPSTETERSSFVAVIMPMRI